MLALPILHMRQAESMTSKSSVVCLALMLAFPAARAASAAASGERLQVRWEQQDAGKGGRLEVRNLDSHPLPAQGWSLYFNCIECAAAGPLAGQLAIEELDGTLYRLRPQPGFAGLAPGQSLDVAYRAPSPDAKAYRAPSGLYLVYDAAPDKAQAIADYRMQHRPSWPLAAWNRKLPLPPACSSNTGPPALQRRPAPLCASQPAPSPASPRPRLIPWP